MSATSPRSALPKAGIRETAGTTLMAGLAAWIVWESVARILGPLLAGTVLDPAFLIQSVSGITSDWLASALHILTGIIVFPVAYSFVVRPIVAGLGMDLSWWLMGLGYGVALWVVALYFLAHLIAGMPAFLDFAMVAWVSLIGHAAYGVVLTGVLAYRQEA